MASKKDVTETARRLRGRGWTVEKTGSGHQRVTNPANGAVATMPTTPSEYRGVANMQAQLRRAGWDPDQPDPERLRRRQAAQEASQRMAEATAVLDALQRAPGALTPCQLAERVSLGDEQVAAALRYLAARHPEIDCCGERYAWDPPATSYEVWKRRQVGLAAVGEVVKFEAVDVRPDQGVVLRDETGRLWLATPMLEADLAGR